VSQTLELVLPERKAESWYAKRVADADCASSDAIALGAET
jgi:hypothetical protein